MQSDQIFCLLRKKWVKRTPEEEVRQAVIYHLTDKLHYPASLMAVEYALTINERRKRCDIVVFNRHTHTPVLIVECKAPQVALTDSVLQQILNYNLGLRVPYLLISNGQQHIFYAWQKEGQYSMPQAEWLDYESLLANN